MTDKEKLLIGRCQYQPINCGRSLTVINFILTDDGLICQCRLNWWTDILSVGLEREHAMVKCLLVALLSTATYNCSQ